MQSLVKREASLIITVINIIFNKNEDVFCIVLHTIPTLFEIENNKTYKLQGAYFK